MKTTERSLRHYQREIFKEHRFIGLPHGVVAAGPAVLAALCVWRLSLSYSNPLTWLLPVMTYLAALALLIALMPKRGALEEMARQAQREARALVARECEASIDEV